MRRPSGRIRGSRGQGSEHDEVVGVVAVGAVEGAGAGDEAQLRAWDVAVHLVGREGRLRGLRPRGDDEGQRPARVGVDDDLAPTRSSPRRKNTAGPVVESTWPAMIAGPISPGAGPSAYQPARS